MPENLSALLLASTSPRRRELLTHFGYPFEVVNVPVQELDDSSLGPVQLVQQNALLKALPVSDLHPDRVVIGADTVVALGDKIFGKPSSMEEAARMLGELNGREHFVYSGVCIVSKALRSKTVFFERTVVRFKDLNRDERWDYLHRIEPLDKAGAYAAQDDEGQLIESFSGSFSNVIGLPMEALSLHLRVFGFESAHASVHQPTD